MTDFADLNATEREILLVLEHIDRPTMKSAEVYGHLATDITRRDCNLRLQALSDAGLVEATRNAMDLREKQWRITSDGQRVVEAQAERLIDAVGWVVHQPASGPAPEVND